MQLNFRFKISRTWWSRVAKKVSRTTSFRVTVKGRGRTFELYQTLLSCKTTIKIELHIYSLNFKFLGQKGQQQHNNNNNYYWIESLHCCQNAVQPKNAQFQFSDNFLYPCHPSYTLKITLTLHFHPHLPLWRR